MKADRLAELVRVREAERRLARVLIYDAATGAIVRRILCPAGKGEPGFTFWLPDNGRARPA